MSMSAYICSKSVNIAKGIMISSFLVCTLALASGGSGGGGTGSKNPNSMYAVGKKAFMGSVVCPTCPYASLELNSEEVSAVWPDLQPELKEAGAIGQDLLWWQRKSVVHYIKKRFSL